MQEHEIICRPSAFKHGVTEADIRRAFGTARYDCPMESDEGKNLLLGFNTLGNLLEIMYYELDDGTTRVIHAMRCRKKFFPLLNQRGNV